jgi:hypothetical protein
MTDSWYTGEGRVNNHRLPDPSATGKFIHPIFYGFYR